MNTLLNIMLDAPSADHFLFMNGKINTVAIVVLIIWGGTLGWILLTDRKVSRLEKKADELNQKLEESKKSKS
jgi:hypothetical protein